MLNLQSHKKATRFLSVLLVLCTLISLLCVYPFTVSAAPVATNWKPADYVNQKYDSAEAKWETMGVGGYTMREGNYEMRLDPVSAEIAVKNCVTGEIQFSNPYDLSSVTASIRPELLSQVALSYQTPGSTTVTTIYSYINAVREGQINVKKTKNGFSVSYTMGSISRRYLVPMMVEASRFQELILDKITNKKDQRIFMQYYELVDINDELLYDDVAIAEYKELYPFLGKEVPQDNEYYAKYGENAYYAFYIPTESNFTARQKREIQSILRTYCPEYTFEELEYDHEFTMYEEGDDAKANPLFKLTLEYYLDQEGLQVSLPSNSIRFDETEYILDSVKVLPYFGMSSNDYEGYTFLPDGSGTLIDFQDSKNTSVMVGGEEFGTVYGPDGALYSSNVRSNEKFRLPVFGAVEQRDNAPDRGFFAVIEEGEAMASITAQSVPTHPFQMVYATFCPRPTDENNLATSNAAVEDAKYTLVSDRKYTGDCSVRYFILNDTATATAAGFSGYDCSYVGMAKLYRDYLQARGALTRMAASDVQSTLPLYIESFGVMDIQDSFLSIPITSKLPLTTFEDLETMAEELKAVGITNVNFRLKGFANGGMTATAPTKIKFEKKLGGNDGYNEFVKYARENGIGVFADFDFVQVGTTASFDGFSNSDDALKTIDNRYIRAKKYNPVYQTYSYTGNILVSPEAYQRLYTKFVGSMLKMDDHIGISVGTLGSTLNSDFDEDDSYNRTESQGLTTEMLSRLESTFHNLMIDAGNAYALPYANHILNVSLDSSHYQQASYTVPFTGIVLHGFVNFSGSATNMASEPAYETLKMIENGAAPYYILSYQNTNKLKDDKDLSDYYAVSYEYGKDGMIEKYKELNAVLADLQTVLISDHNFLQANRIRTEAEILYDTQIGLTQEQIEQKYLVDDGTVVKVTYENGVYFYLNYNYFDVTVNGTTIPSMGYLRATN